MKKSEIKSKELKKIMNTTKVIVCKTKQTIIEEQHYECSDEVYEKIKNAKSEDEKMKIWDDFCLIDGWETKLTAEDWDNWTEEVIGFSTKEVI